MRRRRALLLVGAGVAALALAGAVTAGVLLLRSGDESGEYRGSRPPDSMMLPEFTLPDYEGESVSTQKLRGTVVLVTFLDAQCTEACPIIASQVTRTVDRLTHRPESSVFPSAFAAPMRSVQAVFRSLSRPSRITPSPNSNSFAKS